MARWLISAIVVAGVAVVIAAQDHDAQSTHADAKSAECPGAIGWRNVSFRPVEGKVRRPPGPEFDRTLRITNRYGHRHRRDSADMYLARRRGKIATIGFASRFRNHRDALLRRVPSADNLRFFRARFSIRRLERIQRRIRDEVWAEEPPIELRSRVSGLDIAVVRNVVVVHLEEFNCGDRRKLQRRYGERKVHVPPRDFVVTPLEGPEAG